MKQYFSHYFLLAVAPLILHSASGQTTSNVNLNLTGSSTITGTAKSSGTGSCTVNPFGGAALSLASTQGVDANFNATGPIQVTTTIAFSRLDTVTVVSTIPDPGNALSINFSGSITGGTGAYDGATGTMNMTITVVSGSGSTAQLTLGGNGNITVSQKTTAISLVNCGFTSVSQLRATISATGTGSMSPFGNVTLSSTITSTDLVSAQGTATFTRNANDSLTVFFSISNLTPITYSFPATVTGGTGIFANAAGSATMTIVNTSGSTFTLTGSGTVTQPAAGTVRPTITSVKTSGSDAAFIAPNAWVEIQGTNLVPANTPAAGVIWSNAPEFASGRMPTQLGGISATVNGKPAYIYYFCKACDINHQLDQINVLTSLDATVGQMLVVVTNGAVVGAPFIVTMQAVSPSFLRWDLKGHPVATHVDFSLLGPPGIIPGATTTPARRNETILVYGDGFGLPTGALVEGSSGQSGDLPNPQPACLFGTTPVAVISRLVSPGLYGFGLTVPNTAVSGDNPLTCFFGGAGTPAGDVINVQ